ncbi:MAG: hypothetical protein L3J67_07725 [Hyphomicrobiaceae bacterium]|nr:hypothetical protein [Hyphomicrobiaceae bacterium]
MSCKYPINLASLLSCTRLTSGWSERADGSLQKFAAGELRITDKGLLIEEARTNLNPYSDIAPNLNSVTTPPPLNNTQTAPDGTLTSWSFPTGATGVCQSNITLPADSEDYTFSIYVKPLAAGGRFKSVALGINTNNLYSYEYDFDTDTASISYWGTLNVEKFANGWYRFSRTFTNDGAGVRFTVRINPYAGHEEKVAYWGIQVEQGSFPSSRIKTSGATMTRAPDLISFSDLSWLDTARGTFLVETNEIENVVAGTRILGSNSPDTPLCVISNAKSASYNSGSYNYGTFGSGTFSESAKHAVGYSASGRSISSNGGTVDSDSTLIGDLSSLYLGSDDNAVLNINGRIKSISYWPERKSDAELQGLTT